VTPAHVNETPTPQQGPSEGAQPDRQSQIEWDRSKLPWGAEVWERIDKAVELEIKGTRIGARFLPEKAVPPKTASVPADSYTTAARPNPILTVADDVTTPLNEYYVEFELTARQVRQEESEFRRLGHSTAVTLATKAANTLAQAEDLIVFQGANAIRHANLFTSSLALHRGSPADTGLLNQGIHPAPVGQSAIVGPLSPPITVIRVARLAPSVPGVLYGPNTFDAVSRAYSFLHAAGHCGPYALVLQTTPYADTFAPLGAMPALTADRIKPLATAGFFGTGTLPPNPLPPAPRPALPVPPGPPFFGVLVSVGGNTADLVRGLDPMVVFMGEDPNGNFRFRVAERFALRVKDTTAIIVFRFD
jgi:uncharacterized linocin/CFP29 family protein